MSNDLQVAQNIKPVALFTEGKIKDVLESIETEARALVADPATAKGRKAIASNAAKVARSKTYLDGLGKDLVSGLKEQCSAVDLERRTMRARLDALKIEVRKPLTDFEDREKQRIAALEARLNAICVDVVPADSGGIKAVIDQVSSIAIDASWQEFELRAAGAKALLLESLGVALDHSRLKEAEEQRQAEAAEKARIEREKAIAEAAALEAKQKAEQEAADRARVAKEKADAEIARKEAEAERAKQKAAADIERAALEAKKAAEDEAARLAQIAKDKADAAIARARQAEQAQAEALAAQQAEATHKAQEVARQQREDKARAADKAHRAAINNAALESLQQHAGLCADDAKTVIKCIATGHIANISITY